MANFDYTDGHAAGYREAAAQARAELAALRARVAELEAALRNVVDNATERVGYYGYPQTVVEADAIGAARKALSAGAVQPEPTTCKTGRMNRGLCSDFPACECGAGPRQGDGQ